MMWGSTASGKGFRFGGQADVQDMVNLTLHVLVSLGLLSGIVMERLRCVFRRAQRENRAAAIAFTVAGYPSAEATVEILTGMQRGGVDIIELGLPFTDPIGDGPVIQEAHATAVKNGISFPATLEMVARARRQGVDIPIVLMGYCNPIFRYGWERAVHEAVRVGVDGFLLADLPVRESVEFRLLCSQVGLSYIPVVSPSMTDACIQSLCTAADGFIYVLSRMGVTGSNGNHASDALPVFLQRLRQSSRDIPLALGLGVSTREQFLDMQQHAEGVIVGTQIIKVINQAIPSGRLGENVQDYCAYLTGRKATDGFECLSTMPPTLVGSHPDVIVGQTLINTRFGPYGGQYVPELLMDSLAELETCFVDAREDEAFWKEYEQYLPTTSSPVDPLPPATNISNGATVWVKRGISNANPTATHRVYSTLGQILLARRLGKKRILAEAVSAGDAISTATLCATLGLECLLFMGAHDARRFPDLEAQVHQLGATVVVVDHGQGVRDAINAALQAWIADLPHSHYIPSCAIGPHPYPLIVRTFQSRFGAEVRTEVINRSGKPPDVVVAGMAGGDAVALFSAFVDSPKTELIAVDTAGIVDAMSPGVLHGAWTEIHQDANGQVDEGEYPGCSGWERYPALEPELSSWGKSGRVRVVNCTSDEVRSTPPVQRELVDPSNNKTRNVLLMGAELASQMGQEQTLLVLI